MCIQVRVDVFRRAWLGFNSLQVLSEDATSSQRVKQKTAVISGLFVV